MQRIPYSSNKISRKGEKRSLLNAKKMTLSKLKFSDDNFYSVTITKKNVMVTIKQ